MTIWQENKIKNPTASYLTYIKTKYHMLPYFQTQWIKVFHCKYKLILYSRIVIVKIYVRTLHIFRFCSINANTSFMICICRLWVSKIFFFFFALITFVDLRQDLMFFVWIYSSKLLIMSNEKYTISLNITDIRPPLLFCMW